MPLPTPAMMSQEPLTVAVFGMGLGESILIRSVDDKGAHWAVIDSAQRGSGVDKVNPALKVLVDCDAAPELCVLTHPHLDHTKGFADLVRRASAGATVCCVEPLMEPFDELDALIDADDVNATSVSETVMAHVEIRYRWRSGTGKKVALQEGAAPLRLGSAQFEILHPSPALAKAVAAQLKTGSPNLNDVSAVLRLRAGAADLLFAGDGEDAAWAAITQRIRPAHLRDPTPLKVPHHGSFEALHATVINRSAPLRERVQVVTPFPNSGRLPRFEAGDGAEVLCDAAGGFWLTAMPLRLVPTRSPVALSEVRAAMALETLDESGITFRPDSGAPVPAFAQQPKDPRECWVLYGVSDAGAVTVARGDHAVQITA